MMPRKNPSPKPARGRPTKVLVPHSPAEQIGANLRRCREARGLTIRAAAERLGVPEGRWKDWELAYGTPPLAMLLPICRALGCEVLELLPEIT